MADINAGTGLGLREFLERAGARGDLNPSTANALKASASSVLGIEDDPDNVDIRGLDVDSILERFTTLNSGRYTPASMKTYQSRFKTAVALYTAWLDGDSGWKKIVKPRRGIETRNRTRTPAQSASPKGASPDANLTETDSATGHEASQQLVTHKLPLRRDLIVQLTLPVDLTTSDAARIANFVKSLAFGDPASLPPEQAGTPDNSRRPDGY